MLAPWVAIFPLDDVSDFRQRAGGRRGLRGRAELRPTSARWAWVEYMLAQCGPEGGLAAYDAWKAGYGFVAWRKAFEARACVPYEARRTVDGRRNSVTWPTVGRRSGEVHATS